MIDFEVGETYGTDEIPENEMNSSGNLELVDREGTLALVHEGQLVEFEYSHFRCTDVKYFTEDGRLVEEEP